MAWPGWPGTARGISSPYWGTNVQLYVRAAIAGGTEMIWGPGDASRLDAGNVWADAEVETPAPPTGMMWVDIGCDVLDMSVHTGSDQVAPFENVAEAGTCELTLLDTDRKYDPTNPDSPFVYGGQTRLTEGAVLRVFAETLTAGAITQWNLFNGTVDTWNNDWQPHPEDRRARVVASDCTKLLQGLDWGEQPAVGNGDSQYTRMNRILTYYGWTGPTVLDNGTAQYQATTLAQSAWELLGRVMSDSNGYLYVDGSGAVCSAHSGRWTQPKPTVTISVGCGPNVTGAYDIVMDVDVSTSEIQNSVSASRTGGTMSTYRNSASVLQYGERGAPKRTDLGLYNDANVKAYADSILATRAFPKGRLTAVTVRPAREQASWPWVFVSQRYLSKEAIEVNWQPPDDPTSMYETRGRPFGVQHTISRRKWEVRWSLALADIYARVLHAGPHARDKLDDGNVVI